MSSKFSRESPVLPAPPYSTSFLQSEWDSSNHSVCSRGSSTSTAISEAAEVIAVNPVKMDKVHRKVKTLFIQRGVNGIPSLSRLFLNLDKRSDNRKSTLITLWEFRTLLETIDVSFNARDLEALFFYHCVNEEETLDLNLFLGSIRYYILGMRTHQVETILRKLRGKLSQTLDPKRALRNAFAVTGVAGITDSVEPPESTAVITYGQLLSALRQLQVDVSASEVLLLFAYFYFEVNNQIMHQKQHLPPFLLTSELEVEPLLTNLLDPPSANQKLTFLQLKMIETCQDRDRNCSGVVGLVRWLQKLDESRSGVLTSESFKSALKSYGCGLADAEIEGLFQTCSVFSGKTKGIPIISWVQPLRAALATAEISEILIEANFTKLRGLLAQRSIFGILSFHRSLLRRGQGCCQGSIVINAGEVVAAVRDMGITANVLADVEIEMLFNQCEPLLDVPTPVISISNFLTHVRGELSPAKVEVIRLAWTKISGGSTEEVIPLTLIMSHFRPQALTQVRRESVDTHQLFFEHFEVLFTLTFAEGGGGGGEVNDIMVSKSDFFEYWSNIAAALTNTTEFTLLLWNVFGLANPPSSGGKSKGYTYPMKQEALVPRVSPPEHPNRVLTTSPPPSPPGIVLPLSPSPSPKPLISQATAAATTTTVATTKARSLFPQKQKVLPQPMSTTSPSLVPQLTPILEASLPSPPLHSPPPPPPPPPEALDPTLYRSDLPSSLPTDYRIASVGKGRALCDSSLRELYKKRPF